MQIEDLTEKGSKFIQAKVYTKAISKMVVVMDLVEVLQARAKFIKACLTMIKWRVKEFICGLMGEYLKVFGQLEKNKVQENTSGQTAKFMKEISKMTIVMELENYFIQMVRGLKERGEKETNMVEECIFFQTDHFMKQFIRMERNQEKEN